MTAHDVEAGAATFDRIGRAADRLSSHGFFAVHEAVVRAMKQRRGELLKQPEPSFTSYHIADHLIDLADQLEVLADRLDDDPATVEFPAVERGS